MYSKTYPKILNLPRYSLGEVARRIHELRHEGADIIDLSQLNPNLPPPQLALDRLVQASLMPHNHRYTASSGISALKEAFSDYYSWKFKVELEPQSEVVVTSGTKEGIVHLLMSILSPGDSMLVPVPAYPVHTAVAALLGVSFIGVPLWKNYPAFMDAGGVLSAESEYFFSTLSNRFHQVWPRPKVILISFPHNPTTTIVTKCFYQRLVSFAKEHGCFIINDFAHGDLFFDEKDIASYLSVDGAKDVGVEIYSLSKGFSLGGWRIGAAVGNLDVLSALKSLKSYTDFGIFQPLQIAANKLLKDEINSNGNYVKDVVSNYKNRCELVINSLMQAGWSILKSKASPFIWARMPEVALKQDSADFCRTLLEEKKVAFFPGTGFDSEQVECVRISLTENESRLREAMTRLMLIALLFIGLSSTKVLSDENCPKALTLIKKAHVSAFSREEIKKGLEEAINICPHMVEGLYEFGRFFLQEGKYDLAEAKFKEADALKPRVEHALGIALSQTLRKDYAAAENTYKQALTTFLGHWSLLEGLGVLYLELNKLPEAEELLRQALQTESSVDSIYYNLALVLEREGRIDEALVSYRTALEKNEKSIPSAIGMIRLLLRLEDNNTAIRIGEKALLHAPNNENLLFVLADAYVAEGRFGEAKRELNKVQNGSAIKRKVALALVDLRESDGSKALTELEALSKADPNDLDILRGLGMGYAFNRNYLRAEEILLKAYAVDPNDPVVLNNLGTVYEGLGQIDKAKDYYTRAQTVGSFRVTQENLERLK